MTSWPQRNTYLDYRVYTYRSGRKASTVTHDEVCSNFCKMGEAVEGRGRNSAPVRK